MAIMTVSKNVFNNVRSSYNRKLCGVKRELDSIRGAISQQKEKIAELEKYKWIRFNSKVSYVAKKDQLSLSLNELTSTYREYSIIRKKLQKTMDSLSRSGFQNVTYLLPFLCITSFGMDGSFMYLLLSGIKKNAQEKSKTDDLFDDVEKILWALEKELNTYLDGDLRVNRNKIESFWKVLMSYIDVVYYNEKFSFSKEEIYDRDFCNLGIAISLIKYIVCYSTGFQIDEDGTIAIEFQKLQNEGYSEAACISTLCEKWILKVSEKNRNIDRQKESVIKDDLPSIRDYIVDDRVIKLCDKDTLDEILQRSHLSNEKKTNYTRTMEITADLVAQEKYENKRQEYCDKLLSSIAREEYGDISLRYFSTFSMLRTAKDKIDGIIDQAIEYITPLLDELQEHFKEVYTESELYALAKQSDDVDIQRIVENIDILVQMFREDLHSWTGNWKKGNYRCEEQAPIVYYPLDIKDIDGKVVSLPNVLVSLASVNKQSAFMLSTQLSQILDKRNTNDRELRKSLPCTVYINGRESKIFYTIVDGITVIIDMCEATGDEYKRVVNIVRSQEFSSFLQDVRNGKVKNDALHSEIILKNLNNISGKKEFIL